MTWAQVLAALLDAAAHHWWLLKETLKGALGLHDDALHLIAGILLQGAAALLLRLSLSSWWPWLTVLAVELANEASDLVIERWPDRGYQIAAGAWDLAMTLVLPTLVLFVALSHQRFRPAG